MSFRKTLSRFKEKVRHKPPKIGDKPERGANVGGEELHRPASSSQSEPGIVVEGDSRGGGIKVSVGKDDPRPDDSQSVSRSVVGTGHNLGGSNDNANGGETGQKHLHPHPHTELEGGPSQEMGDVNGRKADRVDPAAPPRSDVGKGTTTPSISRGVGSETKPAVPDPAHVDATTSKDRSDWKHTASSTAKLFLRTTERASDAFPPLKSVAAGLCAILDNCERTKVNKQKIQSLGYRVQVLAESLCAPASEGDFREKARRKELEWRLEDVRQALEPMTTQKDIAQFLNNIENAQKLNDLVDNIREAVMDYQTSLQLDIYDNTRRLIVSLSPEESASPQAVQNHLSMSSTFYIPPPGLRFRLIGYVSQCAIFSRNTMEPYVWHYSVSHGEYSDQWFTLLHGTGSRSGRYAIKGRASGKVLFSRNRSPPVGHIEGDGKYEDNWFKIEPHSGQYADNFRLITPSEGLTLFSRSSMDPTFSNYTDKDFYTDQLFSFLWEDMKVDKVEYKLDAGKIISPTPITLAEHVLTNNLDSEQEMSFSINESVTNSSTFEYSTGFTVTIGTEFSVGVPFVAESKLSVEASNSNTWTWGKTTEYSTQYTATFPVKAGPHKSVRASSVVDQGMLDVPYTMYMSSKSTGVKVQTTGTWHGALSWDLRHTITALN